MAGLVAETEAALIEAKVWAQTAAEERKLGEALTRMLNRQLSGMGDCSTDGGSTDGGSAMQHRQGSDLLEPSDAAPALA